MGCSNWSAGQLTDWELWLEANSSPPATTAPILVKTQEQADCQHNIQVTQHCPPKRRCECYSCSSADAILQQH